MLWPSILFATPRESVMLDCGFSPLMSSLSDRNMRLGDVLLPPGIKQRCLYLRVQGLCRDPGLAYARLATTQSYGEPRTVPTCLSRQGQAQNRSEEHTSELQSRLHLVCRLL